MKLANKVTIPSTQIYEAATADDPPASPAPPPRPDHKLPAPVDRNLCSVDNEDLSSTRNEAACRN